MMTKPHLLIVEDDMHLLEGVRSVLEIEGYDITTAENGVQALKLLVDSDLNPDLIISDIMMPQMDGVQFLREVRKDQRWVQVPFIFLTARGEKADIHQGKRLGVDDYIVKPFDTDDLLIAIESRLRRHEALNVAHENSVGVIKRNILNILNHEFRTPLTYIVAYADMLNQPDTTKMADEDMLSYLKGVNSGALRLRRLVENFILLVEMETGEAERAYRMRRAPIENVREIFEAALRQAEQHERAVVNPIDWAVDENLPRFLGDAEYLKMAMYHLIDNAVKFSGKDSKIRLFAYIENQNLHIGVTDYGRGISEEEQEKIWNIFYQINRAYYEDQGVGAGLPIVRGVAKLHGGNASLESATGDGSTFEIIIPVKAPTYPNELKAHLN
jgi:two-component system, sensor histidine kinase and response regulator